METKYYDLTHSQKTLFFSQKYTLHKQINNISMCILLEDELNLDILKKAISLAYQRMDSLSIRLIKKDGDVKQYFSEDQKPKIGYMDFRDKTFAAMEKKLYKIARKRITYYEKPLSEIYIIHSNDGRNGIFFKVSHFILDAWSISTLFMDIFAIYESLINKSDMPKALYPYETLLVEDLNYQNSESYEKGRQYYFDYFSSVKNPIYSHVSGTDILEKARKKKKDPSLRYNNLFSLRTKAKNIMIPVDKDFVNKMTDYCSENRIPMQTLILLALRSYLSRVTYNEKTIAFYSVVARRATLQEKKSGGSRVHFFPLITNIDDNENFDEACRKISQRQTESYRHISIDPLEQLDIMKKVYKLPALGSFSSASLTFQPVKLNINNMKSETKWYGNGASGNPLYITVMDGDGSGGLKFYYEYQTHNISRETINKLHNFIVNFIEEGRKDMNTTIGEIKERVYAE